MYIFLFIIHFSYSHNLDPQTSLDKNSNAPNVVISAQKAEEMKIKEKRQREREVNFFFFISDFKRSICFCQGHLFLLICLTYFISWLFTRKIFHVKSAEDWKQLGRCWRMKKKMTVQNRFVC